MNLLKLSNKFLNVHAKRLIYFTQIQSHLMYGLSVWGNMIPNGTVEKLQKLQNCCLGYINGKNANMVNYHKLNILRIKELIALENYKYGYKLVNNMLPPRLIELSKSDHVGKVLNKTHQYNTRYKNLLNKPLAKNKKYKSSIVYIGTSALEPLKVETIAKRSLSSFIYQCKKELLRNYAT